MVRTLTTTLVELMNQCTIIVATTFLFVAHKLGFLYTVSATLVMTCKSVARLSYTCSGMNCLRKSGTACIFYQ
jgi:hypothetical protein